MDSTETSTGFDPDRVLRAMRTGHAVALGIFHVDHGAGWCALAFDYDRRLISDLATGILASGPIVSLMDVTSIFAVTLARGGAAPAATLDLRLDYLRPATPGARVTGRAECYRVARRVAFVRGIAHDGEADDPIAHVAGTFALTGEGETSEAGR